MQLSAAGGGDSKIDIKVSSADADGGNVRVTSLVGSENTDGSAGASSVTLQAQGDIAGDMISAKRIDLTSSNGTINVKVNAGQSATERDTLSSSVNAQAMGNIVIEQSKGDMRIGRIYSDGGDVTLRAEGTIIDALPYDTSSKKSETELKEKWAGLGLIESAGGSELGNERLGNLKYDSKIEWYIANKADKASYEAASAAWHNEHYDKEKQAAEEIEKQAGRSFDEAAFQKSFQRSFDQKYVGDATGKLTAPEMAAMEAEFDSWYAANKEAADKSGMYVDSFYLINTLNASAVDGKLVTTEEKNPNIVAKDITLEVGSDAGFNSETTLEITAGSTEAEWRDALAKLSRYDASQIELQKDAKGNITGATVHQKLALGVEATGNIKVESTATAAGKGNAYLEGRQRVAGKGSDYIVLEKAVAGANKQGDILIKSLGDIRTANDSVVLQGKNITLKAMNGSIGSSLKYLNVATGTDGWLDAMAGKDIFINGSSTDTLTIQRALADNVNIRAAGIASTEKSIDFDDDFIGTTGSGAINLTAKGNIGAADRRVRIHNADTEGTKNGDIILTVGDGGEIFLAGVNTEKETDDKKKLTISKASGTAENADGKVKTLDVDADGWLSMAGNDYLTTDAIRLKSTQNLENAVKLQSKEIQLVSVKGSVSQTDGAEGILEAELLKAEAQKDISLGNHGNRLQEVRLASNEGNVLLGNGGSKDLTIKAATGRDITVINYVGGEANKLIADPDGGSTALIDSISAEGNLLLQNDEGAVTVAADKMISAGTASGADGNLRLKGKTVEVGDRTADSSLNILIAGGAVSLEAENDIFNDAFIVSNNGINFLSEKGNIYSDVNNTQQDNTLLSAGNILMVAENGTIFSGDDIISDGGSVTLISKKSIITGDGTGGDDKSYFKNITGTKGVALVSLEGSVANIGKDIVSGEGNVTIEALNGYVVNEGDIKAEKGEVSLTAGQDTTQKGNIIGNKGITLGSGNGAVSNEGSMTALDGVIGLIGEGNVSLKGSVTADGGIYIDSQLGNVYSDIENIEDPSTLLSMGDIEMWAENGSIISADNIESYGQVKLISKESIITGDEGGSGNLRDITGKRGVTLTSMAGDVYNEGKNINSQNGDVILQAAEGEVKNTGTIKAAGNVSLKGGKDVSMTGDVTGAKGISVVSEAGNIFSDIENPEHPSILSSDGDIELLAKKGSVVSADDIQAGGNVTITSSGTLLIGDDSSGHSLYDVTGMGKVSLSSLNGAVINVGKNIISGKGDVELLAPNGSVENLGDVKTFAGAFSENGSYTEEAMRGMLGRSYSETDAELNKTLMDGVVKNSKVQTVEGGDISIKAKDYIYNGKFNPSTGMTINGNIKQVIDPSDYHITLEAEGDVYNYGSIWAGGLTMKSTVQGDIGQKGFVDVDHDINMFAKNGSVFAVDDLTTYEDINIKAEQGSIMLGGNLSTDSNITLEALNDVYMRNGSADGEHSLVRIVAKNGTVTVDGTLSAEKGSLDIGAAGDVQAGNLSAGELLAVGSQNGSIEIGKIAGDKIVLYNSEEGNSIRLASSPAVGSYIGVHAATINMPEITPTGKGPVTVTIAGAGNGFCENYKETITGKGNGIKYAALKVKNAEVVVEDGFIDIDQLVVTGKADFINRGEKTTVFGGVPTHNGASVAYILRSDGAGGGLKFKYDKLLFGTDNKQGEVADAYRDPYRYGFAGGSLNPAGSGQGSMDLHISGFDLQRSNGLLLHKDNYRYVFRERFSIEETMREQETSLQSGRIFGDLYVPVFADYDRFNVVDTTAAGESLFAADTEASAGKRKGKLYAAAEGQSEAEEA